MGRRKAVNWKSEHRKVYEARVVSDSISRLARRFDLKALPFSEEELQILAKRARESFRAFRSAEKKERLLSFKNRLSTLHGETCVEPVWIALEQINNEIGYEEK